LRYWYQSTNTDTSGAALTTAVPSSAETPSVHSAPASRRASPFLPMSRRAAERATASLPPHLSAPASRASPFLPMLSRCSV
jgi:hypothetical protein